MKNSFRDGFWQQVKMTSNMQLPSCSQVFTLFNIYLYFYSLNESLVLSKYLVFVNQKNMFINAFCMYSYKYLILNNPKIMIYIIILATGNIIPIIRVLQG